LNTEVADPDGIVSISSNRFSLEAGNYLITWTCPFFRIDYVISRLYDYTNTAQVAIGCAGMTTSVTDRAEQVMFIGGAGRATPSGTTEYEIQYECYTTQAAIGLGIADYFATAVDQYTLVEIFKEA
jgi:hypothetical protein